MTGPPRSVAFSGGISYHHRVMGARRGIGWVMTTALAAALVAGCSSDDASGTPVLDLATTGAGTCLDVPDSLGDTVTKLPTADCAKEHTHEIYAVLTYDESDVFPGDEALNAYAERSCTGEFEPYVGVSLFDSQLLMTWLVPTLSSWNDHDDDKVLCVLADFQSAPLVGSMKGSKR